MKKHNEGYSLVLVLVVLVLMSLVASFILSVSLKNLQSQTAAVSRMEDKYAATGAIEKIHAQLTNLTEPIVLAAEYTEYGVSVKISMIENETDKLAIEVFCIEADDTPETGIKCTLHLVGSTITTDPGGIKVTKPTEVKYTSYEYLAREVDE